MRSPAKRPAKKVPARCVLTTIQSFVAMPFFTTRHHTLHYITVGDAQRPALLMLHGFLGSHQDFEGVLPALSEYFCCIVPDLPGHGQTLTQPNQYTFPSTCASLLSLLDELNYQQVYLLGYSMGGRLALYMACHAPGRFLHAILESASPGLKTLAERREREKKDWAIAQKLETMPLSKFLDNWYKNELFSSLKKRPELYREMRSRRETNNSTGLANALRGFSTGLQPSLWESLLELAVPLLLIVGEQDTKFFRIAEDIKARNQQFEIRCCSNCGHNVHLESSEQYVQLIVETVCH